MDGIVGFAIEMRVRCKNGKRCPMGKAKLYIFIVIMKTDSLHELLESCQLYLSVSVCGRDFSDRTADRMCL